MDKALTSHKPDLHRYSHELPGSALPRGVPGMEEQGTEQGMGSTGCSKGEANPGKEGTRVGQSQASSLAGFHFHVKTKSW